eukprot:1108841-Alexandrium_andersonii.AAC.1
MSGLSRANSKGLRGLRIGELRIGACALAISWPRTPSGPAFVDRFGICARNSAERTPRGLWETYFEAVPGPA